MKKIITSLFSLLWLTASFAAQPLWTFTPLSPTSVIVGPSGTVNVQYRVTSQAYRAHTLVVKPMQGVTQITSGAGVCGNPFTLSTKGSSCILSLEVNGSQIDGGVLGGPSVCVQGSDQMCFRPPQTAIMQIINGTVPTATLSNGTPTTGPVAGGTAVTLTGTNLQAASFVNFGGVASSAVTIVDSTTVTAVTPAHAAGVVDITVGTPGGNVTLSNAFTYIAAPTVTAVNPASGNIAGGNSVTLTGTTFITGDTTVTFDGVAGTSPSVSNATTMTVNVPTHAVGYVDVVATTSNGSGTLTNGYQYTNAPTIGTITPNSGVHGGGTAISIFGGFSDVTSVTIGGTPATGVSLISPTQIDATTPAHSPGQVDVIVNTSSGSATKINGFTYLANPSITSISPNQGAALGGTTVTITGEYLDNASVTFSGPGASVQPTVLSTSFSTITLVTGAGVATQNATVTVNNGVAPNATTTYSYLTNAPGQQAAGGIIGCMNGGLNNLIAATVDNSSGMIWGPLGTIGATAQSPTNGSGNTDAIILAVGDNGGTPYAAKLCKDYRTDLAGNSISISDCNANPSQCYADWFLPAAANPSASGQLYCLYQNNGVIGGFIPGGCYSSSTENSVNPGFQIWTVCMDGGLPGASKTALLSVRCVRAFS